MLLRRTLTQHHRRLLNIKRVDGGVVFQTTNGLNGRQVTKTLPALWLRWNCSCHHCVQPSSGQKLLNPAQWPAQPEIEQCWIADDYVRFKLKNDSHEGMIPVKELEEFILTENTRYNSVKMTYHKYPNEWIPTIDYSTIHDEKGQHLLTKQIATNGYCIVQNCPTEADSVQKVASCITPVVPSIYGHTFDVVSTENAINVAYTNVELPLHMDLIYMESAPGLQYLLCRRNDESVTGGDSIIVDAYAAAEELRHKDPDAFNCLATTQIRFQKIHYERDFPVHLEWEQPHIVLGSNGDIVRLNWAPAFEGKSDPASYTDAYLQAYRKMAQLIDDSPTRMTRRLNPGECLRCYTNLDEFRSRAQVLEKRHGARGFVQRVGNSNNI